MAVCCIHRRDLPDFHLHVDFADESSKTKNILITKRIEDASGKDFGGTVVSAWSVYGKCMVSAWLVHSQRKLVSEWLMDGQCMLIRYVIILSGDLPRYQITQC